MFRHPVCDHTPAHSIDETCSSWELGINNVQIILHLSILTLENYTPYSIQLYQPGYYKKLNGFELGAPPHASIR